MDRIIRAGLAVAVSIAFTTAAACGGGEGGAGGGGSGGSGHGGAGTGGHPAATCLDGSAFAELFSIADDGFCAVAVYEANESIVLPSMIPQAPSWGSHGGPLWFVPDASGGGITLERWKPPSGATGQLTKQTTHVDAMIPDGAFAGAQAIDTPFFGWTAISWTGAFPDTQGKITMITAGGAVDRNYDVNGAFALAAVGDATSGRLLYTGLSPIGMAMENTSGFYAADACDMPKPDLGAGDGCSASAQVAAWGDSSGPVAADGDGNAFVVLASFGTGDQEARGFATAEVARGAKATAGTKLFTLPGFGSSLAALAPRGGKDGVLVFQPFDSTATPLDVIAQPYTASGTVSAKGTPGKLLAMPPDGGISLSFFSDDQDRLWVAAPKAATTTFVVIARKP